MGKKPKEAEGLVGRGLGLFEVILEKLESNFFPIGNTVDSVELVGQVV